jgi:hypothetical protein
MRIAYGYGVSKGVRPKHDFSVALLEAAGYFSESGQARLERSRFK